MLPPDRTTERISCSRSKWGASSSRTRGGAVQTRRDVVGEDAHPVRATGQGRHGDGVGVGELEPDEELVQPRAKGVGEDAGDRVDQREHGGVVRDDAVDDLLRGRGEIPPPQTVFGEASHLSPGPLQRRSPSARHRSRVVGLLRLRQHVVEHRRGELSGHRRVGRLGLDTHAPDLDGDAWPAVGQLRVPLVALADGWASGDLSGLVGVRGHALKELPLAPVRLDPDACHLETLVAQRAQAVDLGHLVGAQLDEVVHHRA